VTGALADEQVSWAARGWAEKESKKEEEASHKEATKCGGILWNRDCDEREVHLRRSKDSVHEL
jgi:hypothetical protein